ncbi:MAG TPA: pilus assembly PilX N-terminal domain-containing protein [Terriglobales bacterium]|jgi:hypothetical protein|nr:pilus assembly PilX N-terminal domain-containing protein [Terriglobales bacterium]
MKTQASKQQRGAALFTVVFALMLLSALGFGLLYMSNAETGINANYRSSQQAYFAALAGTQEVRERMTPNNTGSHKITGPAVVPGAGNTVLYVINPKAGETVNPTDPNNPYFDDQLCKENYQGLGLSNPGPNQPCIAASTVSGVYAPLISSDSPFTNTSAAMAYKWVRITMKANNTYSPYYVDGGSSSSTHNREVCWNGVNEQVMPTGYTACDAPPAGNMEIYKPVYVLTAYAKGSRRMTQMEVSDDPPLYTKAAIDSQDHVILNGNLVISGYDFCSCQCTTTGSGNSRTTTCTDRTGKVCDQSHYAIYSAGNVQNPNSSQYLIAGTSPVVAENMPWTYNINAQINRFKNSPGTVNATGAPYNFNCSGSPPSCGTRAGQQFGIPPAFPPNPVDNPASNPSLGPWYQQVTYIPGSLQTTANTVGAGVLVVDGDLDVHGGLDFYGLILVKGVISFTGGGSSNTNIFGAVLAGQESRVDTVLGGSAVISYNLCALPKGRTDRPPVSIANRELNY